MKLRLVLDHTTGYRFDEDDYAGTFAKEVDAPFDRTPSIHERIQTVDGYVLNVRAVTWRFDGPSEIRVTVDPDTPATSPTRRELVATGWTEQPAQDGAGSWEA